MIYQSVVLVLFFRRLHEPSRFFKKISGKISGYKSPSPYTQMFDPATGTYGGTRQNRHQNEHSEPLGTETMHCMWRNLSLEARLPERTIYPLDYPSGKFHAIRGRFRRGPGAHRPFQEGSSDLVGVSAFLPLQRPAARYSRAAVSFSIATLPAFTPIFARREGRETVLRQQRKPQRQTRFRNRRPARNIRHRCPQAMLQIQQRH